MKIRIFTVDAFTDKPFSGNPAAVCLLEKEITEDQMKKIASEMNLSETAFVEINGKSYSLRWFTPDSEVDLCGHATLATSHVLWEEGVHKEMKPIRYKTKSGELMAILKNNEIELDFPAIEENEIQIPDSLVKTLGFKPIYLGKTKWNYIAEMESDDIVRQIKPNFDLMETLEAWGTIITARSASTEYDFVSRFFAPLKGIREDPVTGSAHCVLGPYWMKRLHKNEFKAFQASKRGGEMGVKVEGERVKLTGKAVTVLEGKLYI